MRKRIALYTESFPPKSGGVSVAQYNIYHLLKDVYDIKVYVFYEEIDFTDTNIIKRRANPWIFNILKYLLKVYLRRIDKTDRFGQTIEAFRAQLSVQRMNQQLKRFNPDFIMIPDHYLPIRGLKKNKKSKVFWCAHHNYSRFSNNPLIQSNNWADLHVCQSMEKKASGKANFILSPSKYMAQICEDTLQKKPLMVIHNFIVPGIIEKIEPSPPLDLNQSQRMIYIPSAGTELKGKRYIFEIVRRLSLLSDHSVSFYLSGHIPDDLKMELSTLQDTIIFAPGHLSWEENIAIVKTCYLGITPTLVENFSYAILEAQTSGIPFITFDTGGNKELIENAKTGFVVSYLDIENLLLKVSYLLNNNEIRNKMGAMAKEKCENEFSPGALQEHYMKVLD